MVPFGASTLHGCLNTLDSCRATFLWPFEPCCAKPLSTFDSSCARCLGSTRVWLRDMTQIWSTALVEQDFFEHILPAQTLNRGPKTCGGPPVWLRARPISYLDECDTAAKRSYERDVERSGVGKIAPGQRNLRTRLSVFVARTPPGSERL